MRALIAATVAVGVLVTPHPADAEPTGGCHDAVAFLWPSASRAWAHKIVHRESRGNPRAQNPRSTAAGCFGILRSTWEGARTGISWDRRYDPIANVAVAARIYRYCGPGPWTPPNYGCAR